MNTAIGTSIQAAAAFLQQDQVVAMPTETVYGLAGNAFSIKAVETIYAVKQRPLYNPLIVHVPHIDAVQPLVTDIPNIAKVLWQHFAPGPLTLLLPRNTSVVPDIITAGMPQVAIRIPNHPIALALLQAVDFPLAAPSANPFGYISPTTTQHVYQQLQGKIPYILEGGSCTAGIESTVVGFDEFETPIIYRLGAITQEQIIEVAGICALNNAITDKPLSPGMVKYHYSPNAQVLLSEDVVATLTTYHPAHVAAITLQQTVPSHLVAHQIQLSPTANLHEAARNLYAALHTLDDLGVQQIIAEVLPDIGIGKTLNERLKKAAAK